MRDSAGRARAVAEIDARLREHTDPERKRFTEGYFPSALENLGVAVPHLKKLMREWRKRLEAEPGSRILELAQAVVDQRTLEGRQFAYHLVNSLPQAMEVLDRPRLERLAAGMDNWVSVDVFSTDLAGPRWQANALKDTDLRRWARSKDRWWRRAALVSCVALHLPSRGGVGGDVAVARTVDLAERLVDDHDDMVVKGLSFALRSMIRTSRPAVEDWLERHADRVAARVRREVQSKLTTGWKTPPARRKKA